MTSMFIGSGAYPLITALLGRRYPEIRNFGPTVFIRWQRDVVRSEHSDVMLGNAGALLAASEVEGLSPGLVPREFVRALHEQVVDTLRFQQGLARLKPGRAAVRLGLSHGLAGYALALESARAAFGLPFRRRLRTQCLDLIDREQIEGPDGSALWPIQMGGKVEMHGWCHGGPGIGLAMLACYKMSGINSYQALAEPALEGAFRCAGVGRIPSFCCGGIGRAQILLEAFRLTGKRKWLRRARAVARQIPRARVSRDEVEGKGFHKGSLGARYLLLRLADPRLPLPGLGLLSLSRSSA